MTLTRIFRTHQPSQIILLRHCKYFFTSWQSHWSTYKNFTQSIKISSSHHIYWNAYTTLSATTFGWQRKFCILHPLERPVNHFPKLTCISATQGSHSICLSLILKLQYMFCRRQKLFCQKKCVMILFNLIFSFKKHRTLLIFC